MREAGNEGGGFIGDEMGIGKTMEIITYFVVTSWLITNFRHVQRSCRHSELAKRHLPPDASQDSRNTMCPSQSKFPILCSCVPGGITLRLEEAVRDGAMLVIVPASLLFVWMEHLEAWNAVVLIPPP